MKISNLVAASFTRGILGSLLCVALACSFIGCDSDTDPGKPATPEVEEEAVTIDSALEALQPDQYDISVPSELPSTYLNNWATENLDKLLGDEVDESELREKLAPFLSSDELDRIFRREFVVTDSVVLRDMIWARQLVEAMRVEGEPEIDQVTRLFYWTAHSIRLPLSEEARLPLGPFECALYGRGEPEDRAWAFASLIRQLRLPLLICDFGELENAPVVGGVLLNKDVFLFDFELGLPIPAKNSSNGVLPEKPATLAAVQSDDSLLRGFDLRDSAYPLTSDHFSNVNLKLVGETSIWARRMEAAQYAMSGVESNAIVFEPLVAHGAFEDGGVMEIVAEGLGENASAGSIGIWAYPEAQRVARQSLTDQQQEQLDAIHFSMNAPRAYRKITTPDNQFAIEYGSGQQLLLQARIKQISGQPQKAVQTYVKMQGWSKTAPKEDSRQRISPELMAQAQVLPEEVALLHHRAAIEALFWQGACQFELGKSSAAASDFGFWRANSAALHLLYHGVLLEGISNARIDKAILAGGLVKRIPANDRRHRAAQFLFRRWSTPETDQ